MSVSVEILANGKKVPPLAELLGEGLEYGAYGENYVLREAEDDSSVIAFDPACICRGICVETSEDSVTLGLSTVTGASEIRLFYDLVRRACKLLGASVYKREEAIVSAEQTNRFEKEYLNAAADGLRMMAQKLESGEEKNVTLFGALNPVTLDTAHLKAADADPEKFGALLHRLQNVNAYYASPRIYQDPQDGSLVGVYSVPCGARTIFPYAPAAPFYLQEKVDRWIVYIYISDEEYGYVEFADFAAHMEKPDDYDAAHYILELDADTARKIIKEHPAEM